MILKEWKIYNIFIFSLFLFKLRVFLAIAFFYQNLLKMDFDNNKIHLSKKKIGISIHQIKNQF